MAALPQLESQTSLAIQAAWVAREPRKLDKTLRCSSLGNECERRLWYGFRWAHEPETFTGRTLRIFETGNVEETRLCDDLRLIGCDVLQVDGETGNQFEVSFLGGHLTGHTDGEVSGIPEAPKTPHLLECKSHNDKSFKELKKFGVRVSKPVHFSQMQIYMHGRSLTRALYLAVNKNDDEIYTERLEYDPAFAMQLVAKAERIVTADAAPPKLHEDPNAKMAWACGYCPARGVCHGGDFAPRNCRTCLHSEPVLDGDATWRCMKLGAILTKAMQERGCDSHLYLPSLVPGEQIDADVDAGTVSYRMLDPNGDEDVWIDGFAGQGLRSEIREMALLP
jgi:hypothetical protein